MMKFKKSLLALAIVGAVALPSLSSAATLNYQGAKQISFAKDLIVNDGTTIYTPNTLQLAGEANDGANLLTVTAGSTVTVKVTLTNNAKFDSTADATRLVENFLVGTQLGGTGAIIGAANLVGTPYYSASGQELNFSFKAPGNGAAVFTATDYSIQLNSMQVTQLVQGLFTGSAVGAQITVQNASGQQILASSQTIATSQWGLAVTQPTPISPDGSKLIDVGASPRDTLFSPSGAVGGSMNGSTPVPGSNYFNAGTFTLDVSKAVPTDGSAATYINNYNAVATNPQYNVVSTAVVNVSVTGTDLTAFTGGAVWLDATPTCSTTPVAATEGTVAGGVAKFSVPASNALFANVTSTAASKASTVNVCFAANNTAELVPQTLTGSVSVAYNLSTQRVDPPAMSFKLLPLALNGTTLVFQNVNPAGNPTAQSFLRLTNNNAGICPVNIDAKDDAGKHTNTVSVSLAGHQSLQINSNVLEGTSSMAGVTGSFGKGTGKWYVRVSAECSNFKGSALNRNSQTGTVTDLTPEKYVGNEWLTPSAHL